MWYVVGDVVEGGLGSSMARGSVRSIAYIFPACHSGGEEWGEWDSGSMVIYEPCNSWTRRRGAGDASELWGGYIVMLVWSTAWCCRATHPSVARKSDHLVTNELHHSKLGGAGPYAREGDF